jgi:hypothetical protein
MHLPDCERPAWLHGNATQLSISVSVRVSFEEKEMRVFAIALALALTLTLFQYPQRTKAATFEDEFT